MRLLLKVLLKDKNKPVECFQSIENAILPAGQMLQREQILGKCTKP